jgi:hypothetical protein
MDKLATTVSQGTKHKVERATTRADTKRSKEETVERVVEIVFGKRCLHWSEIMTLSRVNKTYHRVVKSSPVTKIALERLLSELDSMAVTHEHHYCGEIYAPLSERQCNCPCSGEEGADPSMSPYADVDPRYLKEYDEWSLEMKCSKMIAFLTMLASNFRSHFDFDDLSRRTPDEVGAPGGWSFGLGNEIADEILQDSPRRSTLMLNLAVLSFGGTPVSDDHYFNDAFLGTGSIDPVGSMFGVTVCEIMYDMGPFRDKELLRFVQTGLYPSPKSLALLGLPLSRKVCTCAPLFDSIPPFAEKGKARLPVALEPVDKEWLAEFRLSRGE